MLYTDDAAIGGTAPDLERRLPDVAGGALRSQSVRRSTGPATLDGAIFRIDPATGQGLPDNPFASSSDPNARRIVAYGLRNPFRMTQRPGSDELWIGDVGWNNWEEINRLTAPTGGASRNFGWPCYEGDAVQGSYQSAGLSLCSSLYSTSGSVAAPYYTYDHGACVVNYPSCRTDDGTVHRITYTAANQPPTARISASPTSGNAPLTVSFDGTASTDPEGATLSYSWDLNGDGAFGDATTATAADTYTAGGVYTARLRVTDNQGANDTAPVTITVGNTAYGGNRSKIGIQRIISLPFPRCWRG